MVVLVVQVVEGFVAVAGVVGALVNLGVVKPLRMSWYVGELVLSDRRKDL